MMSSNIGKKLLFSNLSYQTTEKTLLQYFAHFGFIQELHLYRDDQGQSLRKGFLVYADTVAVGHAMSKRPHSIDQREIHMHRHIPNQCVTSNNMSEYLGIHLTVNEIFISRLCSGETREMFMSYFQPFGHILDCRVYNTCSGHAKQTGYAFLRFADYDSVDQIILARPHRIQSKFYHVRKSIPREYNYILSSVKPLSQNKPYWRDFSLGLINMKTQEIIYPSTTQHHSVQERSPPKDHLANGFTMLDPPMITVSIDTASRQKTNSNTEFEIITAHSCSSTSLSIVNSIDNLTPLASPLYSTAIAYSPSMDIMSKSSMSNQFLLTTMNNDEKNMYDLI